MKFSPPLASALSVILIPLLVLAFLVAGIAPIQAQAISNLQAEVAAGRISVEALNGTGGSSGASIRGKIRNTTNSAIRLSTRLAPPLFLKNSSARQNMVAYAMYGGDGSYYREGGGSFISVEGNQSLDVQLIAYCADHEKENPAPSDSFRIAELPSRLSTTAEKIARYKQRFPDDEITVAAQVALWLGQGLTPEEIGKTFEFSNQDLAKAREILRE
jgi:hypothetical protein